MSAWTVKLKTYRAALAAAVAASRHAELLRAKLIEGCEHPASEDDDSGCGICGARWNGQRWVSRLVWSKIDYSGKYDGQ